MTLQIYDGHSSYLNNIPVNSAEDPGQLLYDIPIQSACDPDCYPVASSWYFCIIDLDTPELTLFQVGTCLWLL
jgi:hypothetical protein